MSELAVRVTNLGKRFRIGGKKPGRLLSESMIDVVTDPIKRIAQLGKALPDDQTLWALKDVSFDVKVHEVVGIIGRNGAGKSTLLKILSRVAEPTVGRIEIRGRSSSLLEVGTGFHPELTGRENVFLNGAILGMRKREILAKFDDIVEFSGISKFLDTPVKHYSSGMAVRLAFSVAAHLDPEILMVDEVLAVGDLEFQKRCLGKMENVVKDGRTILFVSHQMNAVRRLCQSCVWIDGGTIRMRGPTPMVVSAYESASLSRSLQEELEDESAAYTTRFLRWQFTGAQDEPNNWLVTDGPFQVRFTVRVHKSIVNGHHGLALWNDNDQLMWGFAKEGLQLKAGVHEFTYDIPALPLRPGTYRWQISLWDGANKLDDWFGVPEMIIATSPMSHPADDWTGILNLPCTFDMQELK